MEERRLAIAFVTGGSGYVGRNVIRRLVQDGVLVRALARSEEASKVVSELGAEVVRGDLGDEQALQAGAKDCDAVFHVAAKVGEWSRTNEFTIVNVDGTRNVIEAAKRQGVGVFVHVSTEAVILDGEPLQGADETVPIPDVAGVPFYGETKAQAERLVLAAKDELCCVIVRPRFVWGRDDTSLLPKILEAVESGRMMWVGGGRHLTSTCHVDNLVEAMMLCARRAPSGTTYFVTDGEPVEFRAFLTELIERGGLKAPQKEISRGLARAAARVCETLWKVFPLPGGPPINRAVLALTGDEVTVNDALIRRELGFQNAITRDDGLATVVPPDAYR